MGRKKVDASAVSLTSLRAARLYRLLTLLGTGPLYWWRPSIVPDMLWATRR